MNVANALCRSLCCLTISLAVACAADIPSQDIGFQPDPLLKQGFDLLYIQKFPEGRDKFKEWIAQHPDEPFGPTALAASYLFEEFYRQGVLTSEFFTNDKRFLRGIEGRANPERVRNFDDAVNQSRRLASAKMAKDPKDPSALFALTLDAGMESDANSILLKKPLDSLKYLKEANSMASQLLAIKPDATDAYVALGSANFIIGSLSGGARFMLWFGGIHGDKNLGIEQVKKSADDGLYLKPFAKILLALAARREKKEDMAKLYLKQLTDDYPASPAFAAEYAKAMGRPVPSEMVPATSQ